MMDTDRNGPDTGMLLLQAAAETYGGAIASDGVNIKISNLGNYNSPPTGGWTTIWLTPVFNQSKSSQYK